MVPMTTTKMPLKRKKPQVKNVYTVIALSSCSKGLLKRVLKRLSEVSEAKLSAQLMVNAFVSEGCKARIQNGQILVFKGKTQITTNFSEVKQKLEETPNFLLTKKPHIVAYATA